MSYVTTDKNKVDSPSLKNPIGRPSVNPNDPRLNLPKDKMGEILNISRLKMDPHRSIYSKVERRDTAKEKPTDKLITFIDTPQVLKSEQQTGVKKIGVKSACKQCKGAKIEELGYYLLGEIKNFEEAKPVSASASNERKVLAGVS